MRQFLIILLSSLTMYLYANAEESNTSPRFGIWAGAGSGYLVANESSAPLRLNVGGELLITKESHVAVGYQGVFSISNDNTSIPSGSGTPTRMVHLFPHIRCFLFPRSFGSRAFSVSFAPGLAVQHTGGMMMSGNSGSASTSIAAHFSAEYHAPIEKFVDLGILASYDFINSTTGTNALPRVQIYALSLNLHYYFGNTTP